MDKPIKILVVEDEFLIAMLLSKALMVAGYDICGPVATAQEAIEAANKNKPNLVLMDIRLAGPTDGIEAAEEIISSCQIPVIFITGYNNDEISGRARKLNPLACLTKPVTVKDLKPIIQSNFP